MAFKALAAHNWHVRDAQNKGMGRAALHIHIWPAHVHTYSREMEWKAENSWNWRCSPEWHFPCSWLFYFSLSLIVGCILSKKVKSLCVLQCFGDVLDEAQSSDNPIQKLGSKSHHNNLHNWISKSFLQRKQRTFSGQEKSRKGVFREILTHLTPKWILSWN